MTSYCIQAKTRTQADVFAAVGLAKLLDRADEPARIRLEGDYFVVEGRDINEGAARELAGKSIYRFISDGKAAAPVGVPVYDLASSKSAEQAKREIREGIHSDIDRNPALRDNPEVQQRLRECAPDPDYRLHNVFRVMQAHLAANKVLTTIAARSDWATMLMNGVAALQQPAGEQMIADIKLNASTNQLTSPLSAKGYGTLKPLTTDRNVSIKDSWKSDLIEYFRYGGYFSCAVPFLDGDGNLRLLVPVPCDISVGALGVLVGELRRGGFGRSRKLKLDVLVALQVAGLLVEHSEFARSDSDRLSGFSMFQKTPAEIISGIHISHYMQTGPTPGSKNVTELSLVAVPGWFPVTSNEDADTWLQILEEHRRVIRTLNEDYSEEIGLIQRYRRMLQAKEDNAFVQLIEFGGGYGAYWMSATNDPRRRHLLPRFTTANIERMVESMAPDIASILKDPGFRSIARAIRKSTVSAQAQKALGKKPWREIRYGLIAEVNRKRFVREELLETLGVFIAQYNAENARQREVKESLEAAPANVTTEELENLARLIDTTDNPALIGALLCAYGTCREPKEPRTAEEAPTEIPEEEIEEVEEE